MTRDGAQVARRATRMSEMMRRHRVDAGKLVRIESGDAYQQARQRCLKCSATEECLLWLDADPPPQVDSDFCPNVNLLRMCRSSA